MKPKSTPVFARESDLCAAFLADVVKDLDWTAYPETSGWDILMVRKDGIQLGIEAKLHLNAHVVAQALPEWLDTSYSAEVGPHYRAVLVPSEKAGGYLDKICAAIGITVIGQSAGRRGYNRFDFYPELPPISDPYGRSKHWHEWCPVRPCALPDYVPDCGAGNPSPVSLTHWKIAAIKLMIILEERPVTRADFKHLGLSPSRWTAPYPGWLKSSDLGYVRGPGLPNFAAQHPANYEQIKADKAKWMPPVPAKQRQGTLPLEPVAEAAQ